MEFFSVMNIYEPDGAAEESLRGETQCFADVTPAHERELSSQSRSNCSRNSWLVCLADIAGIKRQQIIRILK